jgi:phenylalanine-4-hydroxylase
MTIRLKGSDFSSQKGGPVTRISLKEFSKEEHETWKMLYERLTPLREKQLHPIFLKGLEVLGFTSDHIPDLEKVNQKLEALTGFKGVPVDGLEKGCDFFRMLSHREFPIGNFIRNKNDLSYTPAPDVFHDLYGHIPFFADSAYADFCYRFGKEASRFSLEPSILKEYETLFWFGVEFPLIDTPEGKRIFGGGIASSFTECAYALSDKPHVFPFNPSMIRKKDYRIDQLQTELFILKSPEELYCCLDGF